MGKREKRIQKFFSDAAVSFDDARAVLLDLDFEELSRGSHHSFRRHGYSKTVTLKKRARFLSYQKELVQEVLEFYGYKED